MKPNLLIVDDEAEIRESIAFFAAKDFTIYEAANGIEALGKIESMTFDVIISDYNMPGMNGLELVKMLVEQKIQIPVVWLTGRGSKELRLDTWGLGVYDYLEKPFDPKMLNKYLLAALESKCSLSSERQDRGVSKKMFAEPHLVLEIKSYEKFREMCMEQGLSVSSMITRLVEEQAKRGKIAL